SDSARSTGVKGILHLRVHRVGREETSEMRVAQVVGAIDQERVGAGEKEEFLRGIEAHDLVGGEERASALGTGVGLAALAGREDRAIEALACRSVLAGTEHRRLAGPP